MISLASITDKVRAGQRIDDAEALFLFRSRDLLAIGALAASVNEKKNGKRVFFNVNRHVNYTNICVNRCKFCAFSRTADEPGAYIHPEFGVYEYVPTEESLREFYEPYFTIHKLEKSHRHLIKGKAGKRRTVSVCLQKEY